MTAEVRRHPFLDIHRDKMISSLIALKYLGMPNLVTISALC